MTWQNTEDEFYHGRNRIESCDTMTVAGDLAEYSQSLEIGDINEDTISAAKIRLIDSLACGLGALQPMEESIENLLDYIESVSTNGKASVFGSDLTASPEYSALANSTLIRYLDWNDYHADENNHGDLSFGHASSNIGTVLSAAEAYDSTGEDVLTATVLAYELHMRMADEIAPPEYGLDHVIYGLVSSTLAAGKLKGLTTDELEQAVNIAICGHIALYQSRRGELTEWKGIAFGNVARNALVAVEMADHGIHGPSPIFEGEAGLSNLLPYPISFDIDQFGGNDGSFAIHKTNLKPYPVCGAIQTPLEGVFELVEEESFGWQEITYIEVFMQSGAIDLTAAEEEKWDPANRNTADHSTPYCIARAFIDQEMGPQQFTPEKITDPVVRELIDKITVTQHKSDSYLQVETESGSYTKQVEFPRGHHERPFTTEALQDKFKTALGSGSDQDIADNVMAWTDDIENKDSIDELMGMLVLHQR